jgi:hypothetical protein
MRGIALLLVAAGCSCAAGVAEPVPRAPPAPALRPAQSTPSRGRKCPADKVIVGGRDVLEVLAMLGARREAGATDKQLASYVRHFNTTDADRDGAHSRKEYVEDGRFMSPRARAGIFRAADSNADDVVTRTRPRASSRRPTPTATAGSRGPSSSPASRSPTSSSPRPSSTRSTRTVTGRRRSPNTCASGAAGPGRTTRRRRRRSPRASRSSGSDGDGLYRHDAKSAKDGADLLAADGAAVVARDTCRAKAYVAPRCYSRIARLQGMLG